MSMAALPLGFWPALDPEHLLFFVSEASQLAYRRPYMLVSQPFCARLSLRPQAAATCGGGVWGRESPGRISGGKLSFLWFWQDSVCILSQPCFSWFLPQGMVMV